MPHWSFRCVVQLTEWRGGGGHGAPRATVVALQDKHVGRWRSHCSWGGRGAGVVGCPVSQGLGAQRCHLGTRCAALRNALRLSLCSPSACRALPSCWRLWRWRCWPSARAPARCVPSPRLLLNSPVSAASRDGDNLCLTRCSCRLARMAGRSLSQHLRATHSQPGVQRMQSTAQHAIHLEPDIGLGALRVCTAAFAHHGSVGAAAVPAAMLFVVSSDTRKGADWRPWERGRRGAARPHCDFLVYLPLHVHSGAGVQVLRRIQTGMALIHMLPLHLQITLVSPHRPTPHTPVAKDTAGWWIPSVLAARKRPLSAGRDGDQATGGRNRGCVALMTYSCVRA